jgi:hypothetical protein
MRRAVKTRAGLPAGGRAPGLRLPAGRPALARTPLCFAPSAGATAAAAAPGGAARAMSLFAKMTHRLARRAAGSPETMRRMEEIANANPGNTAAQLTYCEALLE